MKKALKDIPANKAGMKKLPTAVRNKMGYKKLGGSIDKMKKGGSCSMSNGGSVVKSKKK